ncbi:hypothetical protein ACWN8P_14785 [Vagococcus salmoninarum]|uniref:Uncharacterized protein n=1 Tax=Vagococcus salmoninarum TaxID=2739 RepID=A0A429ZAQ7_9ENTE|nr:hypothetical protein [Vagococcus salmoninarum]RST90735.1 hypothetical protein CBF35_15010 [Vagococcus salmoninarum]
MKKNVQKLVVVITLSSVLVANGLGFISFPIKQSETVFAAEPRITLTEYTLSAQQVRDWAKAIRKNQNVAKSIAGGVSFLGRKFKNLPAVTTGAILALGSRGPAYLKTVQKAADDGKKLKVKITDYKNYHTSYSIQYTLTPVK